MKEFVIYTGLRVVLFAATLAIVCGLWAAANHGAINWVFAVVIAFLLSGAASLLLLNGQRAKFAARVEERASRAAARFEAMRTDED